MKVQLQNQSLRLRIDEAELASLRAGAGVGNRTRLPGGLDCAQRVILGDAAAPAFSGTAQDWCLQLPRADVEAYVGRLPCRDGLRYRLPVAESGALGVDFEVDVRDSARVRGRARRMEGQPRTDHAGD